MNNPLDERIKALCVLTGVDRIKLMKMYQDFISKNGESPNVMILPCALKELLGCAILISSETKEAVVKRLEIKL